MLTNNSPFDSETSQTSPSSVSPSSAPPSSAPPSNTSPSNTTPSTPNRERAWKPWLVFAGCCMLSCVGYGLVINTPGLYFSILTHELGITHAQAALPISIEYTAAAITSIIAGRLLSRFDSRIVLSFAVTICAATFMLCSSFTTIWQFCIAFAFLGAGYAIAIYLAPSVLLSNWFHARQGTVLGIALGLSGVGGAVFNPIVSNMITTWGWRQSYFITGMAIAILILPFTLLFLSFQPNPKHNEHAYGDTHCDHFCAQTVVYGAPNHRFATLTHAQRRKTETYPPTGYADNTLSVAKQTPTHRNTTISTHQRHKTEGYPPKHHTDTRSP